MEKGTPHCKLPVVKACVEAGQVRATATAYNGARELGINDLAGMCAVVLALTSTDFYKSMTTHADHTVWQDVYHAKTASGDEVYLKLTVIDDVLIVSFKEL
jgi:motility quorum-sensing regulator/GCU-specific mRNA interferase toxin